MQPKSKKYTVATESMAAARTKKTTNQNGTPQSAVVFNFQPKVVGNLNGEVVIASPLYKQHFRLCDGSLEYPEQQLHVWPVRWVDDEVQIALSNRYKGRAGGYCTRFQLR